MNRDIVSPGESLFTVNSSRSQTNCLPVDHKSRNSLGYKLEDILDLMKDRSDLVSPSILHCTIGTDIFCDWRWLSYNVVSQGAQRQKRGK